MSFVADDRMWGSDRPAADTMSTSPPGVPNGMTACPFPMTAMAGFGVSRGRLKGAISDGWPATVQDCEPRPDGTSPVPGINSAS